MATIELETLRVESLSSDIVKLILDVPNSSANVLNKNLFADLEQALNDIEANPTINGIVICSAKPKIFIAGADLVAISQSLDWSDDEIIAFCSYGQNLFNRMLLSDKAYVAAIHGICVGGGLELTLGCHGRVVSNNKRTWLGLPETKLGLIPGWAGTVRMPRLVGVENAARLICCSTSVSPTQAVDLGFVDRAVDEKDLLEQSIDLIHEIQRNNLFEQIRNKHFGPAALESSDPDTALNDLKKQLCESEEIYPEAPLLLAKHIFETRESDFATACSGEAETMAKVWGSDANRGLLNNFFLNEHNKKHPGFVDLKKPARSIQQIGLLGAGLMGSAIAKCFLEKGFSIRVFDVNDKQLETTDELIAPSLNGKMDVYASGNSLEIMNDCDFVLESIVENITVKNQLFERLEQIIAPTATVATNTSTIPIDQLAQAFKHPERFCGFHFSNPVDRMPILEVICGTETDPSHIAALTTFARSIGKIPVVVKDSPGFVVNRMLASILSGAVDLLHEMWEPQEVDAIMRRFGFRLGPFEIVDLIGVDTVYYAARVMYYLGMKCVTLSPILPAVFKRNRLGCKSLKGIYRYQDENSAPEVDPDITELIEKYHTTQRMPYSEDEIVAKILYPAISDAAELVKNSIVKNARDVDICIIHGLSFPKHRGGLLFWADQIGIPRIVKHLEQYGTERTKPSDALIEMAENSESFYN